jgi:multiple sugar transport system permease protein
MEMIGVISPEERRKRNSVALIVGICMFTAFFFVLRKVWLIFTPKAEAGIPQKGGWQFWKYRWAYIILLPAIASVLLWNYFPMFRGSVMAFQDYRVVGESKFTGLQNLADVLWDPVWWSSLGRTLYYMALMLGLGFWTPIVLAVLLAEVSHAKVLYRTLYYLPAVLTGMVVIYLWKLFFDPSDIGMLNMLLAKVGIDKLAWLDNERLAMFCCVLPTVWAGMGPGCLLYLAALKSVPDDLYEAADIDGCGFFKKTWYITLPTLKGLIIIQFIGAFIGASQSTGLILVMTFGGPNEATKVAGLHIFDKAYLMLRFGTAVTMAWMLGVVMLGFTVIQLRRLSRMEFTTADSQKK